MSRVMRKVIRFRGFAAPVWAIALTLAVVGAVGAWGAWSAQIQSTITTAPGTSAGWSGDPTCTVLVGPGSITECSNGSGITLFASGTMPGSILEASRVVASSDARALCLDWTLPAPSPGLSIEVFPDAGAVLGPGGSSALIVRYTITSEAMPGISVDSVVIPGLDLCSP